MRYRLENSNTPAIDYFSLPKSIGEVSGETLLAIADHHVDQARSDSLHIIMRSNTIAGSALIEAMLIGEDKEHHYDDERLDYIDRAAVCLRTATSACETLIDNGSLPLHAAIDIHRTKLQLHFIQVYKDMVCGEITDLTQKEVCDALEAQLHELKKIAEDRHRDQATQMQVAGLKGEIIALLHYWRHYEQAPDPIAIPATQRGGNGNTRPSETHDIVLFKENQSGTFDYHESKEVKSGRAVNRSIQTLGRYAHSILNVNHKTRQITETT